MTLALNAFRVVACCSALALLSENSLAQIYVDVSNVPPGDGTAGNPFVSIQDAVDVATNGADILVAAGAYTENVTVSNFQSPQIIATSGPEQTTWRPENPAWDALKVFDSNFPKMPVVDGFTFIGPGTPNSTGILTGQPGYLVIRNCVVVGFDVGVRSANSLSVRQSIVTGNELGVSGDGGSVFVRDSIVWGNTADSSGSVDAAHSAGFAGSNPGDPGFGAAMVFGDPGLWDFANGDYHLAPNSPCIGAGLSAADIGVYPWDPSYAPVESYCTGKLASQGCVPSIGAAGTASVTGSGPFDVVANDVVALKNGLFFYGYAAAALPFMGGVLCVQPPSRRTPVQNSGSTGPSCSGVFSFDFQQLLQSGVDPQLVPGSLAYGQYWFRDPADPAGAGIGLTDALRFGIAP